MRETEWAGRKDYSGADRVLHARDIARKASWFTRALVWMFGRRLNRELMAPVILRAYERGRLNSVQQHELCADFDVSQPGAAGFMVGR